jgi:hypothetical protein
MAEKIMPRYPVYIPSKGRADHCYTARELVKDEVPFHLIVEPQEAASYAARFGAERVLMLPFRDAGSVVPARNWIKDHSTAAGDVRHWQLDDNIYGFYRVYGGKRIPCAAGLALRVAEDFVDRYENVAIAGLNYDMFYVTIDHTYPPFYLNHRVYSCTLVLNAIPYKWRGRYNEDTDMCLQVLAGGWCTVLLNTFLAKKKRTMTMKGGNTDALYQGDGRLRMARSLERLWPGIVTTRRRFQRPQHIVRDSWTKFDTPLKLKAGVVVSEEPNEYNMKLVVRREIKSSKLKKLVERWENKEAET